MVALVRRGWHGGSKASFLFLLGLQLWVSSFVRGEEARESAVRAAREGRTEEAIASLRELVSENPNDALVAYDLAVILTWARRPGEATAAFERAPTGQVPEYVLAPIIRAYRDRKRFSEAERWARDGHERFPLEPTFPKLLGLVLADQDRAKEAIEVLEPLKSARPADAEIWLALGYAAQRAKNPQATLRYYRQALKLDPGNREAAGAVVAALTELGPPFGADDLWKELPLSARADLAGLLARWGSEFRPRDPRRRFEGTDLALRRLESLLREAESHRKPDRDVIVRLRRDRVFALRSREHWADAVTAARALENDGDDLPDYVRRAEADSLLALRDPTGARLQYEIVLQHDSEDRNAKIGRFYALVEEENFGAAFKAIDEFAASEQATVPPSDRWLQGVVLAAQARWFADMPGAAWDALQPLAMANPANAELRLVTGEIAASRGWPRLSDHTIHSAANLAPKDKSVQLALANSAMRRRRWEEARTRVADLIGIYPADLKVLVAKRDLTLHDSFNVWTEFRYRHEWGDENVVTGASPGSGVEFLTRFYTPPVGEYWRFIGAASYSDAEVTEGLAQRYREGAGVELALADLNVEALIWNSHGSLSKAGGEFGITWQPTDHWIFSGTAASFAGDTPLRAVLNQITADSASASVEYRWHESRSLRLNGHWYDFSDGNQRQSVGLTFAQKLIDLPHFDLTCRPELYASKNSSNAGPYFSPLRDHSGALTLDAEHLIWRRYERSFGQRLAVTGGSYWQQDFGSDWIGSVLYEQVYRSDPWVEIRYGVRLSRGVYDGDATAAVEPFIKMHLRF